MHLTIRPFFLLFLFFCECFISCRKNNFKPAQTTTEYTDSIYVDGVLRTYIVELPDSFENVSLPLVFALHGGSGTAAGMETLGSFKEIAKSEKFTLVYPQGIEKSWNDGRPTAANKLGIDDVKFFSLMIDRMEAKYSINPKMIYVTGISNGGFMSSRLALELSNRFAAAAVDAATMDSGAADHLHPQPVSMIYIHGTADPLVPFEGGHTSIGPAREGIFLSHQKAVDSWVAINHCDPKPIVTPLPDIANDGTSVTTYTYIHGDNETEVVGYTIQNGGHTWPGGWQYLPVFLVGKTCRDINASQTIWEFFKTHPKP